MDAQLVGVAGALAGQAFRLAERTTIGRDRTSQIVIPDADASRHNCVITKHKIGRLILKDQSANGTRVNGELVREQALSNDDLIAVGSSLFRVVLPRTATNIGVLADDAAVPETTAVIRFQDGVREAKRRLVNNAVRETGGVYTEAAKLLGLHPNYLHGLIRNLNLKDELTRLKAELG